MKKTLVTLLMSSIATVALLIVSHFIPVSPTVEHDSGTDCADCFSYSNAYGFPFKLRQDIGGGLAGLESETRYFKDNYIKLGAIVFASATLIQLPIVLHKKKS